MNLNFKKIILAFATAASALFAQGCITKQEEELMQLPRTSNNIASHFPGINIVADTLKSDTTTVGGFKPKPQKGYDRGFEPKP